MVMQTVERFQNLGVKQIRFDTVAINEAARRLFVSCGFRISTIEMLKELEVGSWEERSWEERSWELLTHHS
jgi:RimJ/RimL family protein N-acetyltransferase